MRLFLERAKARVVLVAATSVRTVRVDSQNGHAWHVGPERVHVVRPVMATLNTGITARQRSTNVSSDGWPVAESISLTFAGSGIVMRTRPFSTRFE